MSLTVVLADDHRIVREGLQAILRNLMDRLGLRSVAELTKYEAKEGLSSLD